MIITLTNNQIYNYANNLVKNFEEQSLLLPIKIGFYLEKNKNTLISLAREIEKLRLEIAQKYGTLDEESQSYRIDPDKVDIAMQKTNELFSIEQEVNIYKVNLDDFGNIDLTTEQISALLFMINDEQKEEE